MVYRYERGEADPNTSVLNAMCVFFGLEDDQRSDLTRWFANARLERVNDAGRAAREDFKNEPDHDKYQDFNS